MGIADMSVPPPPKEINSNSLTSGNIENENWGSERKLKEQKTDNSVRFL